MMGKIETDDNKRGWIAMKETMHAPTYIYEINQMMQREFDFDNSKLCLTAVEGIAAGDV